MNTDRLPRQLVVGAGFFLMCAAPELLVAQSPPAAPTPAFHSNLRPAHPKPPGPMDDFAGLKLTPEQQTQINRIHEDMKSRMDGVVKADNLSPEQKEAMLRGLQHMERGQVFGVLDAEQRAEVRKRALARHAAAPPQQDRRKPAPAPLQAPGR